MRAFGFFVCSVLLFNVPARIVQAQEAQATGETWLLTVEPAFTMPLTEPQSDQFGPGGSLSLGLYRSLNSFVLLGVRARSSVFSSGDAPTNPDLLDQPAGGLSTLSLALRLRLGDSGSPKRAPGLFVEGVGGVGFTGDLVRAVVEGGVGYGFEVGSIGLAPVVRYQHVFHDGPLQPDDANLLIAGVEFAFLDSSPPPPLPPPPPPPGPCDDVEEDVDGFEDEDGCPDPDNDGDGILDENDSCPDEPETFNGYNDHDGCPDQPELEVVDDRLVVEEHLFFDFDQSELRDSATPTVEAIAALWARNPGWAGVRIEGHTDVRGLRPYNLDLSQRRVDSVRAALIAAGMEPDSIQTQAYGEMRPLVPSHEVDGSDLSETEHQRNRRVEFVVIHPDGTEVPVDEAAEAVQGRPRNSAPDAPAAPRESP